MRSPASISARFAVFALHAPGHANVWMDPANGLDAAGALDAATGSLANLCVSSALRRADEVPFYPAEARRAGASRMQVTGRVLPDLPAADDGVIPLFPPPRLPPTPIKAWSERLPTMASTGGE